MKKSSPAMHWYFSCSFLLILLSCDSKTNIPSSETINALSLKRGDVVLCGPADNQFGSVQFESSCPEKVKKDFNLAIALLHSFEYDEAEKVFAKVIDKEPRCAMAYWGVAMSNYHQLWPSPPSQAELEKGAKAAAVAQALTNKSKRESGYIEAIALFYKDWNTLDHLTRSLKLEGAVEKLYNEFPGDKEIASFYALSLDAAADPTDKSYSKQKKAGAILTALYPKEPNHPGIVHYIIHTYDNPELAALALPAARKYASVAPASAHAQHMPSHIFVRLGMWDECIQSNLASISSAQCYAKGAGIKAHWDEELHGLDYLVYAYLQKGDNRLARQQLDYVKSIHEVSPPSFKVAYAFAAIPSRYVLENHLWKDAAELEVNGANVSWEKFPWQKAIVHFTRLLGSIHIGNIDAGKNELKNLNTIYDKLINQKDMYKANQVKIQITTAEAWIQFKEGNKVGALELMNDAAVLEDKTEKAPVTPGEVLPARELLGDMLLQLNRPAEALIAYEADLQNHANRFNGLYGAALAAEKTNELEKAYKYYSQLLSVANPNSNRPELETAKLFLKKQKH